MVISVQTLIQSGLPSGYSGTSGVSGFSGIPGPSTVINATQDTTTNPLYPVMVGATGSNQTPKATTTRLTFNASTGALSSTYFDYGITDSISAAGSTQGTATALTTATNNVTTVAASTGVILPTAVAGRRVVVRNGGANALNVYPPTSGTINAAAANAAYVLPVNGCVEFIAMNTTAWYTLSATYA